MKLPRRLCVSLGSLALSGALVVPVPALANVQTVSDRGFVVREVVAVARSEEEVWAVLLKPAMWWNSDHTWSGDAANLSIDARAGGCFCEILADPDQPAKAARGDVEHMRVINVDRPRALRMIGALGPLQSEAVTGVMTIELKPTALEPLPGEGREASQGIAIIMQYVVGGYMRPPMDKMASAVDGVLAEQMAGLAAKLGGVRKIPVTDAETASEARQDAAVQIPVEPLTGTEQGQELGNSNLPNGR